MEKYLDKNLPAKERAADLLSQMTLDEKIAQVSGVFAVPGREEEMKKFLRHGIGQVSTLEFRNCESMEEAAQWQRTLQELIMESSEHHIPAVFHMEGLCGAFIKDRFRLQSVSLNCVA